MAAAQDHGGAVERATGLRVGSGLGARAPDGAAARRRAFWARVGPARRAASAPAAHCTLPCRLWGAGATFGGRRRGTQFRRLPGRMAFVAARPGGRETPPVARPRQPRRRLPCPGGIGLGGAVAQPQQYGGTARLLRRGAVPSTRERAAPTWSSTVAALDPAVLARPRRAGTLLRQRSPGQAGGPCGASHGRAHGRAHGLSARARGLGQGTSGAGSFGQAQTQRDLRPGAAPARSRGAIWQAFPSSFLCGCMVMDVAVPD